MPVRTALAATNQRPQSFGRVSRSVLEEGGAMKWIKPEFEIIDLCTEVTLYLYNR